jgi:hypothetical protein
VRLISRVEPVMETSLAPYPTELTTSVFILSETVMVKLPSEPDVVPDEDPFGEIVAPTTGDPSLLSVIFPEITRPCEKESSENKMRSNEHSTLLTCSNRLIDISNGFALVLMCN